MGVVRERVKIIFYKQARILLVDHSNCEVNESLILQANVHEIMKCSPRHSLLVLVNVENARFNIELISKVKEYTKMNRPYAKASAVIGLTGLQQVMLNAINKFSGRNFTAFDDIEKAKEWLFQQK
jgi:hypothetical protein